MNTAVTATVAVQLVAKLRYLARAPGCSCCGAVVDVVIKRGEFTCMACVPRPQLTEPSS